MFLVICYQKYIIAFSISCCISFFCSYIKTPEFSVVPLRCICILKFSLNICQKEAMQKSCGWDREQISLVSCSNLARGLELLFGLHAVVCQAMNNLGTSIILSLRKFQLLHLALSRLSASSSWYQNSLNFSHALRRLEWKVWLSCFHGSS